jgi:hypothetical protein
MSPASALSAYVPFRHGRILAIEALTPYQVLGKVPSRYHHGTKQRGFTLKLLEYRTRLDGAVFVGRTTSDDLRIAPRPMFQSYRPPSGQLISALLSFRRGPLGPIWSCSVTSTVSPGCNSAPSSATIRLSPFGPFLIMAISGLSPVP